MLALDIDKIYTEPATGIVYNFAGLSKDKEGHKKIGTDVPIKEQIILLYMNLPKPMTEAVIIHLRAI